MNLTRTLMAAALVGGVPVLLSNLERADSLTFHVAEGATVTKVFTTEMKGSLDDMQMLMNGEENPMMPSLEMDMDITYTIQVTDTYGKIDGGRPASLTRQYDEIGMDMDMDMVIEAMGDTQDEQMSGTGDSKLEGKKVAFTWDGDASEYKKAFPEGEEGDDDMLPGLMEDMSLRGMLPTEEVSEGDSWDISTEALIELFAPGGDLGMEFDMGEEMQMMGPGPDPEMMSNFRELLDDEVENGSTAKLTGFREVDGDRIAVIEVEIELDATADMIDLVEEAMGSEELPEGMEMEISQMDMEFIFEGKGELLWNQSKGHLAGFQMTGETAMAMGMAMDLTGMMEMSMEMNMEMSGELAIEVATK